MAGSTITSAGDQTLQLTNNGNVNAYPLCLFVGSGVGPYIKCVSPSSASVTTRFSTLVMGVSDTLAIDTDPRPEHRCRAAIYNSTNAALQFIGPSDFPNNLDFREFFPFLPPGVTMTWVFGMTSGTVSYSFAVAFRDTWI